MQTVSIEKDTLALSKYAPLEACKKTVFFPDTLPPLIKDRSAFATKLDYIEYLLTQVINTAETADVLSNNIIYENSPYINFHPAVRNQVVRRLLLERVQEINEEHSTNYNCLEPIAEYDSTIDCLPDNHKELFPFLPDGKFSHITHQLEELRGTKGKICKGIHHLGNSTFQMEIYQFAMHQDWIDTEFSLNGFWNKLNLQLPSAAEIGKFIDEPCDQSLKGHLIIWPPVPLRADAVLEWYTSETYLPQHARQPIRGVDAGSIVDSYIDTNMQCLIDITYFGVAVPSTKSIDGKQRNKGFYFDNPEEVITSADPSFYDYIFFFKTSKGRYIECPLDILENVYGKPLIKSLNGRVKKDQLKRRVFVHNRKFLLPLMPNELLTKAYTEDWPGAYEKEIEKAKKLQNEISNFSDKSEKILDSKKNEQKGVSQATIQNFFKTKNNSEKDIKETESNSNPTNPILSNTKQSNQTPLITMETDHPKLDIDSLHNTLDDVDAPKKPVAVVQQKTPTPIPNGKKKTGSSSAKKNKFVDDAAVESDEESTKKTKSKKMTKPKYAIDTEDFDIWKIPIPKGDDFTPDERKLAFRAALSNDDDETESLTELNKAERKEYYESANRTKYDDWIKKFYKYYKSKCIAVKVEDVANSQHDSDEESDEEPTEEDKAVIDDSEQPETDPAVYTAMVSENESEKEDSDYDLSDEDGSSGEDPMEESENESEDSDSDDDKKKKEKKEKKKSKSHKESKSKKSEKEKKSSKKSEKEKPAKRSRSDSNPKEKPKTVATKQESKPAEPQKVGDDKTDSFVDDYIKSPAITNILGAVATKVKTQKDETPSVLSASTVVPGRATQSQGVASKAKKDNKTSDEKPPRKKAKKEPAEEKSEAEKETKPKRSRTSANKTALPVILKQFNNNQNNFNAFTTKTFNIVKQRTNESYQKRCNGQEGMKPLTDNEVKLMKDAIVTWIWIENEARINNKEINLEGFFPDLTNSKEAGPPMQMGARFLYSGPGEYLGLKTIKTPIETKKEKTADDDDGSGFFD